MAHLVDAGDRESRPAQRLEHRQPDAIAVPHRPIGDLVVATAFPHGDHLGLEEGAGWKYARSDTVGDGKSARADALGRREHPLVLERGVREPSVTLGLARRGECRGLDLVERKPEPLREPARDRTIAAIPRRDHLGGKTTERAQSKEDEPRVTTPAQHQDGWPIGKFPAERVEEEVLELRIAGGPRARLQPVGIHRAIGRIGRDGVDPTQHRPSAEGKPEQQDGRQTNRVDLPRMVREFRNELRPRDHRIRKNRIAPPLIHQSQGHLPAPSPDNRPCRLDIDSRNASHANCASCRNGSPRGLIPNPTSGIRLAARASCRPCPLLSPRRPPIGANRQVLCFEALRPGRTATKAKRAAAHAAARFQVLRANAT